MDTNVKPSIHVENAIRPVLQSKNEESTQQLYNPLDPNKPEIRLLRILSPTGTTGTLHLEMFKANLDEIHEYYALSYVWGDTANPTEVLVNERKTLIGRNLAAFLNRLRGTAIPVWADALCINQQDDEEKNRQVSFMKEIYGSSSGTLAWLGKLDSSDLVLALMQSLRTEWMGSTTLEEVEIGTLGPHHNNWVDRHSYFFRLEEQERDENADFNKYWKALFSMMDLVYWERVWTLQEMALACNTTFFTDSVKFELADLLLLLYWTKALRKQPLIDGGYIEGTRKVLNNILAEHVLGDNLSAVEQIHRIRSQLSKGGNNLGLVCELTTRLQSTDPRDKIFGLLGLFESSITPDYRKPVSQVYTEFCQTWIAMNQSTDFLHHAGLNLNIARETKPMPTWKPDWHAMFQTSRDWYEKMERQPVSLFKTESTNPIFRAGKNIPFDSLSLDNDTMLIAGILCDEIKSISPTLIDFSHNNSNNEDLAKVKDYCYPLLSGEPNDLTTRSIPLLQILTRTLFLDASPVFPHTRLSLTSNEIRLALGCAIYAVKPKNEDVKHIYKKIGLDLEGDIPNLVDSWCQNIMPNASRPSIPDVCNDQRSVLLYLCSGLERMDDGSMFMIYYMALFRNLIDRILFKTRSGRLGLTNIAQEGDIVAVLAGCSTPVLLRKTENDSYQLVGTCFILGLMDGEALELVDKGEARIVSIRLV
jgi:hypothetical protein